MSQDPPPAADLLSFPIKTLISSRRGDGDISVYDLAEAYNVLAQRLEALQKIPTNGGSSVTQIFAKCPSELAQCIARDLETVLKPNDDDEATIENELLCRHAIDCVSSILAFPDAHRPFAKNDIAAIFKILCCICTPSGKTPFNHDKLFSIIIWTFKAQTLSTDQLEGTVDDVLSVLHKAVASDCEETQSDGLEAVGNIVRQCPDLADRLIPFIPLALERITTNSSALRISSLLTICGFSCAKYSTTTSTFPTRQVSAAINKYIRNQSMSRNPGPLKRLLDSAISNDGRGGIGPTFVAVLGSTLIHLLDYHLFTDGQSLRPIGHILALCKLSVKDAFVRMWQLFLWAFFRTPFDPAKHGDVESYDREREKAYVTATQDADNVELQTYAIACLVQPARRTPEVSAKDIIRALALLRKLASDKNPNVRRRAGAVLKRLLGGNVDPALSRNDNAIFDACLPVTLLNGDLIRCPDHGAVIEPRLLCLENVGRLEQSSLLEHLDEMVHIWAILIRHHIAAEFHDLQEDYLDIWRLLLPIQSKRPSFDTRTIPDLIVKFNSHLVSNRRKERYLSVVRKLWSSAAGVLATVPMSSSASALLRMALCGGFQTSDEPGIKEEWTRLRSELVAAIDPNVLPGLCESLEDPDILRSMWETLARRWVSFDDDVCQGESLANFITRPVGIWDLDESEVALWGQLSEKLARIAEHQSAVIVALFRSSDKPIDLWIKDNPGLLPFILRLPSLPTEHGLHCQVLGISTDFLTTAYSVSGRKSLALEILDPLALSLSSVPQDEIVNVLRLIQPCITLWVDDSGNKLHAEELEHLVKTVYGSCLDVMQLLKFDMSTLKELEALIACGALSRTAVGGDIFEKFWRATLHQDPDIIASECPYQILICLKTRNTLGSSLVEGFDLPFFGTFEPSGSAPRPVFDEFETPVLRMMAGLETMEEDGDRIVDDVSTTYSKDTITQPPSGIKSGAPEGSRRLKRLRTDPDIEPFPLERTKRAKESEQQNVPKSLLQAERSHAGTSNHKYRSKPVKDEEVDYDIWERPVLESDLKSFQAEMRLDGDADSDDIDFVPDSQEPPAISDYDHSQGAEEIVEYSDLILPNGSRRRERSQTAPDHPTLSYSPRSTQVLRRHRTSPSPPPSVHRQQTPSMELLEGFLGILNQAGTSELDVDEIVLAQRRIDEISAALQEQLKAKRAQGKARHVGG